LSSEEKLVRVHNLKKWFPVRTGILEDLLSKKKKYVKAVDGITFDIKKGEIYGLVGESGCGKTTTGRVITRLLEPTEGAVHLGKQNVFSLTKREMNEFRRRAQIIFQDPYESLNPRMNLFDFVVEPLIVHNIGNKEELVSNVFKKVELIPPEDFFYRFPHELSGGQRQRVAIARAIILNPEFIVADEPVSMLDVSIRSSILKLMFKLRDEMGVSFLYITHDLATARQVCDRIAIMYLGKFVEVAPTEELLKNPLHPYSQALIEAVPIPDPTARKSKVAVSGEIPTPLNIPPGCRFHPRCPYSMEICKREEPELVEVRSNHSVACHLINK
jgi:peptide/nickel transport system ATP-binding protein